MMRELNQKEIQIVAAGMKVGSFLSRNTPSHIGGSAIRIPSGTFSKSDRSGINMLGNIGAVGVGALGFVLL